MRNVKGWIAIALLGVTLSLGTGCTAGDSLSRPTFAAPDWAPPYASGARYYYLPDMEVYYDAYFGNFVFWDGFAWSYSRSLPPAYRYHDLYNSNIVLLDSRVNDPWFYHNHYIIRYPEGFNYGPRTHPNTSNPSRGYPSRVYDENENNVDIPSRPRGIDPSQRPERSIQPPRQQQSRPDFNQQPQIKSAPQQRAPQSQPKMRAPSPQKAPVKPGEGKG